MFVLPLSVSILNLVTPDPLFTLTTSLSLWIIRESLIVVWPATTRVPSVAILPVEDATVILSVVPDLTAKFASTSKVPFISVLLATVSVPPRVVLLSTLSVEFNSVWPSAVNVPSILVLPVTLSTKNLSVVPFLTAKSASISVTPLILTVPSITVLPLSVSTVNLSTADPFWILKFSFDALIVTESWIVVLPSTFKVPWISVLPLAPITLNFSVSPLFNLPTENLSPDPVAPTYKDFIIPAPPCAFIVEKLWEA